MSERAGEQGLGAQGMRPPPASARPRASTPAAAWLLALAAALVAGVAPLEALLSTGGLALALALPLLNPVFGPYLAVLSVPVQELATLPGGLSYTQAAVLLAAGAWGLSLGTRALGHGRVPGAEGAARGPHEPLLPSLRLLVPWATLLLALLLSATLTPYSRAEGLKETARWGAAFLVWLIAVATLRRRWQLYGLVACLLAAPAADALIGIAQFAIGDGPPTFRIAPDQPYVRAYGTIGQPNSFAGYLNMAWPLALALAMDDLRSWVARLRHRHAKPAIPWAWHLLATFGLWIATGVLLAGLAASFSRGAWLGAAVGALGLAAAASVAIVTPTWRGAAGSLGGAGRPGVRRTIVLGLWALVIAGAIAVGLLGRAGLLPAPLAARVASISRSIGLFDAEAAAVTPENFAVVERMAQIQAGWRMFRSHPLVGVGPGNYSVAYPDFAVGAWYTSRGHAHNAYLHIAAESGALGLLAYLALLGALVAQGVRAIRATAGTRLQGVAVGCCGIIAAVMGHHLFEYLHVLNLGIQLAGAWALLIALPAVAPGGSQR